MFTELTDSFDLGRDPPWTAAGTISITPTGLVTELATDAGLDAALDTALDAILDPAIEAVLAGLTGAPGVAGTGSSAPTILIRTSAGLTSGRVSMG